MKQQKLNGSAKSDDVKSNDYVRQPEQVVEQVTGYEDDVLLLSKLKEYLANYMLLSVYLVLLLIPIYAIVKSAMNQNWIMMIIDVVLVPVGFVHGLLMLFGVV